MTKISFFCVLGLLASSPALAQGLPAPGQSGATGVVIQRQPNTTGNDRDIVIAPGPTGASTITTDSAAGGNAGHPERAVPNGSANGGGSR
ncbi:MAG: hypothetical protein CMH16_07590 [Methylobacterium sp.]|jgi:hypothetical protein|nr:MULTISPECIES: hypothetical protein [Methylobacterium]AYO86549.1 hypothetical protein EBB05_29810 [Methylobacterium brachiatum]MBP29087.1 hypothetical protein [Methylobacterium sp.]MBP29164.1 hypothetical protein [Methylobacterium sp.]MCB4806330.1 hypothetical protein [Methylobacterium brachiatum]